MSDFFNLNQNDVWSTNKNINIPSPSTKQNTNQNIEKNTDIWEKAAQNYQEKKRIQLENRQRYGVTVPDEIYEVFNQMTARCSTPEEANEMSYKLGSACKYMELMGLGWDKFDEAFANVDNFNAVQFPNLQDQKGRYEALCDAIQIGNNNVKLGELGQKLMKAHKENDTELAASLMAEIDAINQQNILLQDNVPRHFIMQELEAGAQSLPFTGAAAAAGIFGNFIAPGGGTVASFAVSSYLAAGSEYVDMIANGSKPETARTMALISGGIQGIIEANLGITSGIVKGSARLMGKEVAENFAKNKLKEIENKVLKNIHFGTFKKNVINYLERRGGDILGEGLEEFWQENTSILGKEIAAALDGYDIPNDDIKSIVKRSLEAFKGGVLGALGLGLVPGMNPARLEAYADFANVKIVRDAAESIDSEEVFKNIVKDNPIFKDATKEQKENDIHEIWQRAQDRVEEAANIEAQNIAEGLYAGEGAEERKTTIDENGNVIEEEAEPVARDEAGRLFTQNEVFLDDNGKENGGTFRVGDRNKSDKNLYGFIKYETAENGDITITDFKLHKDREGLRGELFDEFAREHPDVNIEWNAIGSLMQDAKQKLINENPSGKKNGLSYYSTKELDNVQARKQVASEIRKNIHNVKRNADGSYTRTELSNKQVAAAVTLIESAARRMNMSLNDYVSKTFGSQIFGSREEFAQATLAQGENVNTKAGGMTQGVAQANWREVGQRVKAVIYAGENADFSTWAHEMAHVFQNQLDGDLKTEAETAFNVVGGDWVNSTYTFADGRTMSSAEAFAYGFQDWLETGKAESEQMKNIFQKFAEFIADAYNRLRKHLDFTPEIESVFNKLLDGDDTIMSKALKAAEEQDNEYRANLKRQAEEKEAQKKAEAEEAKRQEQAEREEASEGTDFEEDTEISPEEAERNLQEGENETTDKNNAIDNALENTNLDPEKKNQIAEVLKDETSTVVAKAEAITEAASSVYDEEEEIPDILFQEVSEAGTAINKDNYFKNTFIDWKITKAPDRQPDYKSDSGSEYWYTDKGVYRRSNHWGTVATCTWLLDGKSYKSVNRQSENKTEKNISDISGKTVSDIGEKYGDKDVYANDGKNSSWNYTLTGYSDFADIKKLYDMPFNDRVIKDIFDTVKDTERQLSYNNKELTENEKNELIQSAIDDYKDGAGVETPETEADKQFIKELSLETYNSYDKEKPFIAFDRGRFKSEPILFQIAGEIGAENLDNSEVQEGVSRMQNLAIAKQMETEGKDAKAIRLATGWEKGADGKWRWEIDDSKIKTDFEDKSLLFRKKNPRYGELEEKLKSLNYDWEKLSKEEQEEFDKLGDLYSENYGRNEVVLMDILDAPELFRAYPIFKEMPVEFKTRDYSQNYEARLVAGHIEGTNETYVKIEFNGTPNSYNSEKFKSILLHEIQHAIQRIEGFAKGANPELFTPGMDPTPLTKALASYSGYTKEELEGFTADKEIAKFKDAGMTDEEIAEISPDVEGMGTIEQIIERDIKFYGIDWVYDAIQSAQKVVDNAGKIIVNGKTFLTDIEAYRATAGEVESRNVQARINFTPEERREALLAATEDVAREDQIMLFQTVYHGSGADFDKFDTENFGFSGEGSMSFGYGTYVTDSEEIARSYAERQRKQFEKDADNPYERGTLEREIFEDLRSFNFDKAKYKDYLEQQIKDFKAEPDNPYIDNKASEKLSKLDSINATNLYTVEIPDDGYLEWDRLYKNEEIPAIAKALRTEIEKDYSYGDAYIEWDYLEELENHAYTMTGANLLNNIKSIFYGNEKEKKASKYLNRIGYAGIKYPAGTIHGNGNGAYNYVIFNDEDVKIIDHLFFQTQAELMEEAKTFESWKEFMDFCEATHVGYDTVSPIPSDSDAQWYQSFWEQAKGLQTEQEKNEQTVSDKLEKEGNLPTAIDALFASTIRNNPELVDAFLARVAEIDAVDLNSPEWLQVENEEGAREREEIDELKDFISITLSDYNWQSAIRRVQGRHDITEGMRKKLIGEMLDNFKLRDFRALYSKVMGNERFEVEEEDTIASQLQKKLSKYEKRYHDILKPNEDIARVSPERRKNIAEQMTNRDIAAKIKNGSLKLDDELDNYIKSLDKQIKEKQKQLDELEAETKADYQRIADDERRKLLKLYEELLLAGGKVNKSNAEINRKINKGLKITEKYQKQSQNLNADYDEIFRKYSDLKNTMQITAEVQAALERQEQVAGLKEDLNSKQKEKSYAAEIKKMRIQLVKRAMRRVPFNRIDLENAKTVIAIQRMLEPNLLGGVNRFIGIDNTFLRGVISQIVTDSDYKEKILSYLSKNSRSSQAFVDFKKKLEELKTIKDFDSWTAKDRKAAIRYLPKENWVRDLNLKQLAEEREESIDLDIGTEEYTRPVYDEKTGEPKTYTDKDGIEHNVTETAFRLKYSDEIGRMVQDAVGADMFDKIVNMPFGEWTTEDLELLAQRIDELYTEGRDLKAAKEEARKREADRIRQLIENAIKDTGIVINDDDTPEEKARKQKQIDKILGKNSDLKGTEAGKTKGIKAKFKHLVNSYNDMNVLRFARMLDGQNEGENYRMLYRKEDDCFNAKQRSIFSRTSKINKVMKDNKITEGDLAKSIKVDSIGTEFTVDELLFFLAADKDYAEDETKLAKGLMGLDANDDYAATSRNAVMFGNMMSDTMSQEEKESYDRMDKEMEEAFKNDTLSTEQKQLLTIGQLDKKPGTSAYIEACHAKWLACLSAANSFLSDHPEYKALMEAIEEDYAEQYDRMNEISIKEFNAPVHRVKAYVPLVRRESNGDTNVNQVKEDLLGAYGAESGKQWVNKGMTQRRVTMNPLHQKPVQTGLFNTWSGSIERTEHFIAYSPYVRQLNAVYKSRDAAYTRRFIESRYGKDAIKYLDDYINEVANPNAGKVRERGAEWLHVLRGKTAPAYLGWKFSGIVKQGLTSPWPYMQFVNPAEYAAAAFECCKEGTYDDIKAKSAFMNSRVMDPINDLVDEMSEQAKNKFDRGWTKFTKIGMQGLEWVDWTCVAPGWLACYKKKYNLLQKANNARYEAKLAELKEKNSYVEVNTSEWMNPEQIEAEAQKELFEDIEMEAVQYADDCTRACQPSSRLTDLAPMFKNSSEAMKAFLQFQTSLNVIWQNWRYDIPYAVKQKQFKRIVGTICGYVFAGIFMNSVMDGVRGDDDDDETQALRNLIYYSTTQFTDAIPIMGSEITNTMDQLITGKRGFAQSGTDMTPSATKLLSVMSKVQKGDWKKAASLTAEGIGLFMGAPVSGTKEIYKLLGKPFTEGDVNIKRGVGDVYGLAGDILGEE